MKYVTVKALRPLTFLALLVINAAQIVAQDTPKNITKEDLANNNKLFIELAKKALKWEEPAEPVRIAGPIYFVGTKGLGAFLIRTSEGHILMNTGMPSSGPMIVDSIRKLRFKRGVKKEVKGQKSAPEAKPTATPGAVTVTLDNFVRAETDMYFAGTVKGGGLGKLAHSRAMADIDNQTVVRMNRDTLYSSGVFDLDAGPVKITLPDAGKRFMSMQVVNQDHYALEVVYGPGTFTYDKAKVGTRYVFFIIRTLANPEDAADMKAANAAQDAIKVEQANTGAWESPNWDKVSQDKIRETLNTLSSMGYSGAQFGKKDEVNPIAHLIGTAIGWGGNPEYAAVYQGVYPKANDGKTVHRITVKDVPVDGFWSISVYNKEGFFQKNDLNAYSLNSLTAKPNADGSYAIQFGGCTRDIPNCLPIVAGWNYTVRLYRPRKAILDGSWKFPQAEPQTR